MAHGPANGGSPVGIGTANTLAMWQSGQVVAAGPAYNSTTNYLQANGPFINVMAAPYSAKGDGVTDDTTAIQAAINAASSNGSIIYFPPGSYIVSAALIISTYATIMGAGAFSSLIIPTNATADVFDCNQWQITFTSIGIVGPSTTVTSAGNTLSGAGQTITVGSTTNFPAAGTVSFSLTAGTWTTMTYTSKTPTTFIGCTGAGAFSTGASIYLKTAGFAINGFYNSFVANTIQTQGCSIQNMYNGIQYVGTECNISDSYILNTVNNGIFLNGNPVNSYIHAVTLNSTVNSFAQIFIQNCGSVVMTDCDIIHGGSPSGGGGLVINANANGAFACFFDNVFFDTCYIGALLTGSNNIQRIKFSSCWFSGATLNGIQLNNSLITGLEVVECDILNNISVGINDVSCADYSVIGCRVAGNGTAGIATNPSPTTKNVRIQNNTIGPTSGYGTNTTGITIAAGTYASLVVQHNNLTGNTTPVTDNSTTVVTKTLGPNAGMLPLAAGIASTVANVLVNTTTDTLITQYLIPAGALLVGSTLRITAYGQCVSTGTTTGNVRLRFGTAGTTADAAILAIPQTPTAATSQFRIEYLFTVRSLGAGGTCIAQGMLLNSTATGFANIVQTIPASTATIAINTTVANFISMFLQVGAATVVTTLYNATVEVVKP